MGLPVQMASRTYPLNENHGVFRFAAGGYLPAVLAGGKFKARARAIRPTEDRGPELETWEGIREALGIG